MAVVVRVGYAQGIEYALWCVNVQPYMSYMLHLYLRHGNQRWDTGCDAKWSVTHSHW